VEKLEGKCWSFFVDNSENLREKLQYFFLEGEITILFVDNVENLREKIGIC